MKTIKFFTFCEGCTNQLEAAQEKFPFPALAMCNKGKPFCSACQDWRPPIGRILIEVEQWEDPNPIHLSYFSVTQDVPPAVIYRTVKEFRPFEICSVWNRKWPDKLFYVAKYHPDRDEIDASLHKPIMKAVCNRPHRIVDSLVQFCEKRYAEITQADTP